MDLIGVQICWIEIFGSASQAADPPDDASIVFHRVSGSVKARAGHSILSGGARYIISAGE